MAGLQRVHLVTTEADLESAPGVGARWRVDVLRHPDPAEELDEAERRIRQRLSETGDDAAFLVDPRHLAGLAERLTGERVGPAELAEGRVTIGLPKPVHAGLPSARVLAVLVLAVVIGDTVVALLTGERVGLFAGAVMVAGAVLLVRKPWRRWGWTLLVAGAVGLFLAAVVIVSAVRMPVN